MCSADTLSQGLDGPFTLHPDVLTPANLPDIISVASTSLLGTTQRFESTGNSRLLIAFLEEALALVDARGRSDPEPALALVDVLCCIRVPPTCPPAARLSNIYVCTSAIMDEVANTALQRAPWWVHTAAPCRLKTANVFSSDQLVRFFEAMARMTLPVLALKSPGIGLMARAQIQRFVLRPSQAMRLLHAWATLLGPTGSCTYRPTPHDVKDLFLCLRPKQLNAGELEAAVKALAAFPWPTWHSWPMMQTLTAEIIARWAPGEACACPCPACTFRHTVCLVSSALNSSFLPTALPMSLLQGWLHHRPAPSARGQAHAGCGSGHRGRHALLPGAPPPGLHRPLPERAVPGHCGACSPSAPANHLRPGR